jgi:DNA-binding response OmpR family regulator
VEQPELADAPGGSETILLVEDDEALRRLIRHVLESRGYTVVTAVNGRDGLTKAAAFTGPIALVLSDVVMPEMSGRVMAERLHATRPGLKVLFLSGHTDDAVMHHGVTDANILFLQKPISPSVLVHKVRELLDQPNAT